MSRGVKGLAVFAVALGIPASAGALARDVVAADPVVAVLLLAIYWLVLGMVGLVVTAAREPVQRRARQLGDAVDAAMGRKFSRYTRHYRQYLLTANRWVDFKGLSIVGDHIPELDEVFVDVAVERKPVSDVRGGIVNDAVPDADKRHSIRQFLQAPEPSVLAVTGGPGCGKTTLLRHLARDAVRRRANRRRIPIFLSLSRLCAPIIDERRLPDLLRIKPPDLPVGEPRGWWEQQLHGGNCLVLMDGLDEVADSKDRRVVAEWINDQITAYPKNDFVVTSRPGGYRQVRIEGAQVLAVQPFSRQQIDDFLRGWYLATERDATGADDSGVQAMAEDKAQDLIRRLKDAPRLDELTTNPLLLTMIALVHRYRNALPRGRVELYEEICRAMLWSRNEAKGISVAMSGEGKWEVLAQLAFNMMKLRVRTIDGSVVAPLIEDALETSLEGIDTDRFLAEVCGNGLLVQVERGEYAFAHQTIGEYLSAKHIIDCGLEDQLPNFVDDIWWAETLELYAAGARRVDHLVRACLQKGTETAIAMAFTCTVYGARLDASLERRLERLKEQAFDAEADPAVRRAVSRALASKHLGSLKRLGDTGLFCPQPITQDLYWLHCREHNGNGGEREPAASQAAAGLLPQEVTNFVDWINTTVRYSDRSASPFRLPTPQEAAAVQRHSHSNDDVPQQVASVWRLAEHGPSLPMLVTGDVLADAVAADLESSNMTVPWVLATLLQGLRSRSQLHVHTPQLAEELAELGPDTELSQWRKAVRALLTESDGIVHGACGRGSCASLRADFMHRLAEAHVGRLRSAFTWLPVDAAILRLAGNHPDLDLLSTDDIDSTRLALSALTAIGGVDSGVETVIGGRWDRTWTANAAPDYPPGTWCDVNSGMIVTSAAKAEQVDSPSWQRLSALILAAESLAAGKPQLRDRWLGYAAAVTTAEQCDTRHGEALILVRD